MRWEYKAVHGPIAGGNVKAMLKAINELGADGWEMCGYATADKTVGLNAHVAWMKRSVQS